MTPRDRFLKICDFELCDDAGKTESRDGEKGGCGRAIFFSFVEIR
jgi:hypothetical protein